MHPIFYYIAPYVLVGGIGMYLGNRKVTEAVARQRWLKYISYLIIVLIVIASILLEKLWWIALLIIIIGTFELISANYVHGKQKQPRFLWILCFFLLISNGFFGFSWDLRPSFQLFIYFQVLIFDAFCQIMGQLFGKRQLSKTVSPSKTIEGLLGGMLFCILSAIISRNWVNASIAGAAVFGVITCATSFVGDMLASYFKRLVQIKDYSRLLPGQGGFLDRFDSFIMTGAVYFILAQTIPLGEISKVV